MDPFEAEVGEWQRGEEGRADCHGVDRGAEVVVVAGEGEGHGSRGAADGGFGFEEFDIEAGLGEHDGRGKAVGACADDTGFATAGWIALWHARLGSVELLRGNPGEVRRWLAAKRTGPSVC